MICRPITAGEYVQADNIMNIAFRFHREKPPVNETGDKHRNIYGAFEGEKMTSVIVANAYSCAYFGNDVGMLGVGGVSTLPEYRREGHIRALLSLVLRESYNRGDVLSSLYPFSHPFYRKFGFENGQYMDKCHLETKELRQFPCTGRVRQFMPGEDDSVIKEIYNAFRKNRNFAVNRRDWEWNDLKKDPYMTHVHTYIWYSEEDVPECYFTLVHEDHGGKSYWLKDWAYLTPRAIRGMLGFLGLLAPGGEKTELWLPHDVNPFILFNEPYAVRVEHTSRGMVRVVNVQKALELHPWEEGADFSLQVADDIIAENQGTFRVMRMDGKTTVEKTEGKADAVFSIQAFSLLCCGVCSLEEVLLCREDAKVYHKQEALQKAFVLNHNHLREDF